MSLSITGREGAASDGTGYVTREECRSDNLVQVEIRRDIDDTIISLLTLGVVAPATNPAASSAKRKNQESAFRASILIYRMALQKTGSHFFAPCFRTAKPPDQIIPSFNSANRQDAAPARAMPGSTNKGGQF